MGCLQSKIDEFLKQNEDSEPFCSCFFIRLNNQEHNVLCVEYSSVFGLYDLYNIVEGINSRSDENHVKYMYENNILTIMIDKNYFWTTASRTSTDILRLPKDFKHFALEYFTYKH